MIVCHLQRIIFLAKPKKHEKYIRNKEKVVFDEPKEDQF